QYIGVTAAEVITGRVQRSADGDRSPGIETSIRIHHEVDELNVKISKRRGGLPDAVPGRGTDTIRRRRRYRRHFARISFDRTAIRGECREGVNRWCGCGGIRTG